MNAKIGPVRLIIGILYISLILFLLFFAPFRHDTNTEINFIPFKSIYEFIDPWINEPYGATMNYRVFATSNLLGNFLVFVPIPILFKWHLQKWPALGYSIGIPFLIELTQNISQRGSANIDDIMLNAAGFILGFWIYRRAVKRSLPKY